MVTHIPREVLEGVVQSLRFSDPTAIQDFSFAGGGCINYGGKLKTAGGDFFLKWNDKGKFPGMFQAESRGLKLLRQQNAIYIPRVESFGESSKYQFLLLEYLVQKTKSNTYWEDLGQQLATLHNVTDTCFGLDHDNFIGSLNQFNRQHSSWLDFFIEQRLEVQLKNAIDRGYANSSWSKEFESLYIRLAELLPVEKPALLHGDLWSGNLISNEKGEPCLIDPAVYFGNREMDLAMAKLFGGFSEKFYSSYRQAYPLSPGFERRVGIYNLYPLLVHVNLFGGSYVYAVEEILRTFI